MKCVFDKGDFCGALSEKQCHGCSFYKSPEEYNAGRKKADERIASLPEAQRVHIMQKYKKLCRSVCVPKEAES